MKNGGRGQVSEGRRDVLRAVAGGITAGSIGLAGCAGDSNDSGNEETAEDSSDVVRYFFEDEHGTLGHLTEGQDVDPSQDDVVTVTDTNTEEDYREMLLNDIEYAEQASDPNLQPNAKGSNGTFDGGYDKTPQEMIELAEEAYNNPETILEDADAGEQELERAGVDINDEPNIHTYLRALMHASDKIGVSSSGGADDVITNVAEAGVAEIQDAVTQGQPDFLENTDDFRLSTLSTSKGIRAKSNPVDEDTIRDDKLGPAQATLGFQHPVGFLQYNQDGQTYTKIVELTDPIAEGGFYQLDVIKETGNTIYDMDERRNDRVNPVDGKEPGDGGTLFPEHFVTAFNFRKARRLETQDRLDYESDTFGNERGLGDELTYGMMGIFDDVGADFWSQDPDANIEDNEPEDQSPYTIVSDSFGKSVEDYFMDPGPGMRQLFEETARGIYQVHQEEQWRRPIAVTGTIEDPEVYGIEIEDMNEFRKDQTDYSNENIKRELLA